MPVPKRKSSRMRSRKRGTPYTFKVVQYIKCPNCGAPVQPHRVCKNCGYYAGKPVIVVKAAQ